MQSVRLPAILLRAHPPRDDSSVTNAACTAQYAGICSWTPRNGARVPGRSYGLHRDTPAEDMTDRRLHAAGPLDRRASSGRRHCSAQRFKRVGRIELRDVRRQKWLRSTPQALHVRFYRLRPARGTSVDCRVHRAAPPVHRTLQKSDEQSCAPPSLTTMNCRTSLQLPAKIVFRVFGSAEDAAPAPIRSASRR